MGHTEGGWNRNIKPASKYSTIFAGRNTHVAYLATSGLTEEEIEANCNLIAAAPDLLEALEGFYNYFADYDLDGEFPDFQAMKDKAWDTIARAKGGQ